MTKIKKGLIIILVCVVLLSFYAFFIEPFSLRVHSLTLNHTNLNGFRIVQFSDVQLSQFYKTHQLDKIVSKINEQNPDLVIFSGDLFENYSDYGNPNEVSTYLQNIKAKYAKVAIWGNRDYGGNAENIYNGLMKDSGFQILKNEIGTIKLENGKQIQLIGLDDALLGNPQPSLLEKVAGNTYNILLCHEPDVVDTLNLESIDLVLSGHSHGGQVIIGAIYTKLAEKYISGLYELNERTNLYVNVGIGTSRLPIRFGVIPEITIFDLE